MKLSMGRAPSDIVSVCKDVTAVQKTQDHDLEDLTVNEVSLVTEPAILTDAESKNHAGFQVVKLEVSEEERVAEALEKSFEPRDNEDYDATRKRLTDVVRKKLLAETGDANTYFMSALKVWKDRVLMGFWWDDDAPTLAASGRVAYYHAYYSQDPASKDFAISRIAPLAVTMSEVTAKSAGPEPEQKNAEPEAQVEQASAQMPKMEHEGEMPMPGMAKTEEPSASTTEEAAPTAEPAAEPEAKTEEPAVEVAPAQEPEAKAVAPQADISAIVAKLAASGQAFSLKMVDGQAVVEVGKTVEPVAKQAETDEVEKLRVEKLALEKERDELRQRVAKNVADEPLLASEITTPETKNTNNLGNSPFDRVVAAGIAQTIRL